MRPILAPAVFGMGLLAIPSGVRSAPSPEAKGYVSAQKLPAGAYLRAFGGHQGCALGVDGQIVCWSDGRRVSKLPIPPGRHKDLVWDGSRGCAISKAGAMTCFGGRLFPAPPAVPGVFKRVAIAGETACGIREDDSLACGASRSWTRADIPKGRFVDLSCGLHDCCALDSAGAAKCWGEDEPIRKPPPVVFKSVSATEELACGIDQSQGVVCWGNVEARRKPPPGRFESVSTNVVESCAIESDGTTTCWGDRHKVPVTLPLKLDPKRPPAGACGIGPAQEIICWGRDFFGPIPEGPFRAIEGGNDAMCGIRPSGELTCFGPADDIVGSIPRGTFTGVSVGSWHACARRADASIACWGHNFENSLEAPGGRFSAVSVDVASCGLRDDGAATCWGKHTASAPKEKLRAISSGGAFTCGVTIAGKLTCFEADRVLGERSRGPLPKESDFVDVVAGYEHVCAIRKGGAIACWGRDVQEETRPEGEARFAALALGEKRSCGLTLEGRAVCWGGTPRPAPAGPFRAIAMTGNTAADDPTFVCAIRKADDGLDCWAY